LRSAALFSTAGRPRPPLHIVVISEVRLLGEGLTLALERDVSSVVCGSFGLLDDAFFAPLLVRRRPMMRTGELSDGAAPSHVVSEPPRKARVFILSDVRLYREALLLSMTRLSAFEMLGAGDLSRAAVASVVDLQPDSIVLDIGAIDSFATARLLGISLPMAKVIAFAVNETDRLVFACAEAGIAGYVGQDGSEEDLLAAVECALRGELYCSKRIAAVLSRCVAVLAAQPSRPDLHPVLTPREHQVVNLIGEGMSNKAIGCTLRISDATVKNHVHNILEKLQVHRRGEAAARYRRPATRLESASVPT
jgi:two-component system, NarL family, nitrate/nitrite response regulator NarL